MNKKKKTVFLRTSVSRKSAGARRQLFGQWVSYTEWACGHTSLTAVRRRRRRFVIIVRLRSINDSEPGKSGVKQRYIIILNIKTSDSSPSEITRALGGPCNLFRSQSAGNLCPIPTRRVESSATASSSDQFKIPLSENDSSTKNDRRARKYYSYGLSK